MADLQVIYNAPLESTFASGTLELKREGVYIDSAGRKAPAYQKAVIGADRSLTDVQTGLPLRTVAAAPGDPVGGPIDWVETLYVLRADGSPMPDPKRQTRRIPGAYTREGMLDLHLPGSALDPAGVIPVRDPTVLPRPFEGFGVTTLREIDFLLDPGRIVYFGVIANLGGAPFQVRHHVLGQAGTPMTVPVRGSREFVGGRSALSLLPVNGQAFDYSVVVS